MPNLNLAPEISVNVTTDKYNVNVTTSNKENVLVTTSLKITTQQTKICDENRFNQTQTDKSKEKKTEHQIMSIITAEEAVSETMLPNENITIDTAGAEMSYAGEQIQLKVTENNDPQEKISSLEHTNNVLCKIASIRNKGHSTSNLCGDDKFASYTSGFLQLCRDGMRYYFKGLSINGDERVQHVPSTEEDWDLEDDFKVANYNQTFLKDNWNGMMIHHSFTDRIKRFCKFGLFKRTFPILFTFLAVYYIISIIILTMICCEGKDCGVLDDATKELMTSPFATGKSHVTGYETNRNITDVTNFCNNYEDISENLNEKEHRLTRILTFLVGFYVSFIMRNWWTGARTFPTSDKVSLAMGSFIWVDSGIDESKVKLKVGSKIVSLMQLKKDILRLCLLSYSMCFCRISNRMKNRYPKAEDFIKKRLLTENEHKLLQTKNVDGWLVKWATPQLWVNRMVCNVDKDLKSLNPDIKDISKRVRIIDPKQIGVALFKYKDDLQRVSNQYNFTVPSLMRHVISIALYFYMMLGAVAGQGNIIHLDNKMSLILKLVSNFPLYYVIKHLLIIAWLQTATDLQNPYGEDE